MLILDGTEEIVRAICSDKFDGERASPSAFTGDNVSVSRLAILPIQDLWQILAEEAANPPERILMCLGKTTVGDVLAVGAESVPRCTLNVHADPTDTNPAHAEIRPKITRGQANRLLKRTELMEVTQD